MGLQLLKPTEAKVAAEARDEEDLRRATAIKDITRSLLDQKAEAERAFEATLATQQARWEVEESKQRAALETLRHELEDLAEQKKRVLIPITKREQLLHTGEEELALRRAQVEETEESLEEERRLLMQRLDEVSEREQSAVKLQSSLESKKKGIEAQHKQTVANTKLLNDEIRDFTYKRTVAEKALAEKEALLNGRELALTERTKQQDEREKYQNDRDKQLIDKYQTLLRTEKEIHARNKANPSQ